MRILARRSIVALKSIAPGETLDQTNIGLRRPGDGLPPSMVEELCQLAKTLALQILGVSANYSFEFPDNRMDSVTLLDILKPLEALIDLIKPTTIYTHHDGDLNIDHRVTHQAVLTACRPQPGLTIREILSFGIVSSTEWANPGLRPFQPSVFVEISAYWLKKLEALKAYAVEMRQAPHARSIDHLQGTEALV